MIKEMRRFKQKLSDDECLDILDRNTACVLALGECQGYPYAIPLSYAREGSSVFFHSALEGQKLDHINSNPKASLCVIDEDMVVPAEYTTYYRSVIAYGSIVRIEGERKRHALEVLAEKYSPDFPEGRAKEIDALIDRTCMLEFSIDHMTGKEARELREARDH